MTADEERLYRAVKSRDARFDGWFVTGVTSTGIYCRPSCPAATPHRQNVRFYATAAAARADGFRPCLRCRPDAAPGSPEWSRRSDLVARAMRLIGDGVVDREGVAGLARRLAFSPRHVHRELTAELGAGPLDLARAHRAQTARLLIEGSALPFTEVAGAAGFGSVRQFNDTVRGLFARSPRELRAAARRRVPAGPVAATPGALSLRLARRDPFDAAGLLGFLADRAVPGVEELRDGAYRRTLLLPRGTGVAEVRPQEGHLALVLRLADLRDLPAAVARLRRLLDLDADPVAVDEVLGADPLLAPDVARVPGVRVPGAVDGGELAMRAVLGQQVSVAAARTLAGRLAARLGTPLPEPDGGLLRAFPTPEAVAGSDPVALGLPAARRDALTGLASRLATGELRLDAGADREEVVRRLLALRGVGPWTAGYVAMRALGDPDVFLATDLGVRRALEGRGAGGTPREALARAEAWRPWRSYALMRLWRAPRDGAEGVAGPATGTRPA